MDATASTSGCSDCVEGKAAMDPSLLLLLPVLLSVLWAVVQLLYGSWIIALLLTKLVNAFLKDSGISIGSIHIDLLTRRVVFKHFHYYCRDYSIRVVNGYAGVGCCKTCCSCSPARSEQRGASMFLQLEGFEYHWYNRSEAYDQYGRPREVGVAPDVEESAFWAWWKDKQPTLHFSIHKGQILLGNHEVEKTLTVYFNHAEAHYCTTQASNAFDELLHRVEVDASSVLVVMESSHGYSGQVIPQPPGYEGSGYRVLETDSMKCVFSQDSPGLVPLGDTAPPKYEFAATLGDNTFVRYGSYANNLRKLLQTALFPNDHVEQVVSRTPQPGERRVHTMFDISVTLASTAKFEIPFTWNQTVHSLTVLLGQHSQLEIHAPWLTEEKGSTYTIQGKLQEVGVASSLPYPSLACAGCVGVDVTLDFPRLWNGVQEWDMKFTAQRAQVNVLFAYIDFVNGLLDDWVGDEPSDLLDFVPVNWNIGVELEQYEIFLLTNRYNWLDLASGGVENTRLAFCGATGQITLKLPFTQFIPLQQLVQFSAKGQDLVVRHYIPPSAVAKESTFALSSANRYRWRVMEAPPTTAASTAPTPTPVEIPVRKSLGLSHLTSSSPTTTQTDSFHDSRPVVLSHLSSSNSETEHAQLLTSSSPGEHVISAPIITATPTIAEAIPLEILNRHLATPTPDPVTPMATLSATPAHGLQLESREFFPMGWRCETLYERGWLDLACGPSISIEVEYKGHHHDPQKGEATPLIPSSLHVDIDAPQVLIRVFGCLARDLLGLKENYPGEYINMTPFRSDIPDTPPTAQDVVTPPLSEAPPAAPYNGPDTPPQRTVNITVCFKLHSVIAEFPGDVSKSIPGNFPLPSLCTDTLRVEVEYVASDTIVCVSVDPISVHVPSIEDSGGAQPGSGHHMLGHVIIQSINFNCHGFTEYMCAERVEYAWMMQLLIGRITGAVSPRQLLVAGDWLLTTVIHVFGIGDSLAVAPDGELICPRVEPIAEEIKYRLFQLDVQEADVHICEGRGITRLQSSGLDLDFCSLHECGETMGVSWQLHALTVTSLLPDPRNPAVLLEAGLLDVGHVTGGVALCEPEECVSERQRSFLRKADERTRRLWFLWDKNSDGCGCCGGCKFLGGSISRRSLRPSSECAMYGAQFQPLEVVPRQLGITGLTSELQNTSVEECTCLWAVHRHLLEHYQLRYGGHTQTNITHVSPPSSRCSDSEIFHSARSSLASSMWLDDEVVSVKLQEEVHSKVHKRSASQLHRDLRAAMEQVDGAREEVDGGHSVEERYSDLVTTSYLHSAVFHISANSPSPCNSPAHGNEGPETTPLGHTSHAAPLDRTPQATPLGHAPNSFQLYLPCLQPHSSGSLPKISPKLFSSTLERRRHAHTVSQQQQCQSDHAPKFSVSVNIGSENVVRLSPLVMDAVEIIVNSVKMFFGDRSAMSILNLVTFQTGLNVSNLLSDHQQPTQSIPLKPAPENQAAVLGLHVSMSPAAFIAMQLLQHSPSRKMMDHQHQDQLQEIIPHKSLVTLYLSGTGADVMIKESQSLTPPTSRTSSLRVAGKVRCPVLQVNLAALVPQGHGCSALPGLVQGQQQMDFRLVPPCKKDELCYDVQDLMEVGLKEVGVLLPATIITSRVHSAARVSWRDVVQGQSSAFQDGGSSSPDMTETMDNKMGVEVSVGSVWTHIAAPQTGPAQPSSGGLDLLVVTEAVQVWQERIPRLLSRVTEVAEMKARRDKQVLLTLLSFAAKVKSIGKPLNPVLYSEAVKYRKTVWFNCMLRLWSALNFFTEVSVPTEEMSMEVDGLLMAATLALASQLYSLRGTEAAQDLLVSQRVVTPPTHQSQLLVCNTGYVSVSPSPSDLAVPNRLYGSDIDDEIDLSQIFSFVNSDSLRKLKESLFPFLSAVGVPVKENSSGLFSNKIQLDFSVELREATVFVLEYLATPSDSAFLHTKSMATIPALFLDKLLIQGNMKHSNEVNTNNISMKQATILPQQSHTQLTKMGVVSNCCASLDDVRVVINTPLLKLAKHASGTGKFRRKLLKLSRATAADSMSTPRPAASTTPSGQHAHFTLPVSPGGHVIQFARSAVREISSRDIGTGVDVGRGSRTQSSGGSSPSSHIKLVTYPSSPRALDTNVPSGPPQGHTLPVPSYSVGVLESSAGMAQSSSHHSKYSTSSDVTSDDEAPVGFPRRHKDVSVTLDEGTSPDDVPSTMDTCGEDTTDSLHVLSSDNDEIRPRARSGPHDDPVPTQTENSDPNDTQHSSRDQSVTIATGQGRGLCLPQDDLVFSIFALLKCQQISCEVQIGTTKAALTLSSISASMDTRNSASPSSRNEHEPRDSSIPRLFLLSEVLPTYLSVAATLRKSVLRVQDKGLPEHDVVYLDLLPMFVSVGVSNCPPLLPRYRCLLKLRALNVELKQSAVKVHKRFQQLMPTFQIIYNDIFGKGEAPVRELDISANVAESGQGFSLDAVMKLSSHLPVGLVHLSLERTSVVVAPLPSLTLTYSLSPVSARAETGVVVDFQLVVGEHLLRFTPKEQYKNELSLRSLTLPYLCLQGFLRRSRKKKCSQLTLNLAIKKLNIDLTTDVLNQLLVVQNTFIKELNDVLQMLTSIGESLPARERLATLSKRKSIILPASGVVHEGGVSGGVSFISLLQSFSLSLAGIAVTVSTPLATALRFSTGKIEMTLTNTSSQTGQFPHLPASAKNQLSLDGRVDIDINLALGYLKPLPVEDDLCELAYFRTRVSIRNTLQNLYASEDRREANIHQDQGTEEGRGQGEWQAADNGTAVDTFLIAITSPHLYLQSSAVEQAILFWLNCKSVYTYWQNEKKQLNIEVQQATEAFMEKINRPNRTPSIDFSRPRLVQISVSDVGACMPIIPLSPSEDGSHRPFPAIVVTIKEMQFLLNLSHKVASSGRFQTFCVRFAEQFSPRQRIWTLDPKKGKITNYGTITRGTFRLCIATKKRFSDKDPSVAVGEKLLSAFQWDMSGINIHANTDVGHHTSTLVRTMTTIASGLDEQEEKRRLKARPSATAVHSPKSQLSKLRRHRRSSSLHRPSAADTQYKKSLEEELAKQTSKIQRMKLAGAAPETLRTEETNLRATQQELSKTVQRMFRHPKSRISLHDINQLLFKAPPEVGHKPSLRTRLFSVNEEMEGAAKIGRGGSPIATATNQRAARRGHRRYVSDVTGMRGNSPTRSPTPPIPEADEDEVLEDEVLAVGEEASEEVEGASGKAGQDGFSLPSIDLEFDITVNVDHGKIVLRTEESASVQEWRRLHTTAQSSPAFNTARRMSTEHKHIVESIILIPALTVKTHYQSIVGRSYLNTTSPYLPSSPQKQVSAAAREDGAGASFLAAEKEELPSLPVKRGVLSLHAVIESLPEHVKLTPSLLDFIEQVAQPTLAAANISSSSSTESISNEEGEVAKEEEEQVASSSSSPLSFPVDVILTFHIQPSTVNLTCLPHSQIECTIQSPHVNFAISFSLFSHQQSDGIGEGTSPTSSTTGPNAKVIPFNNLYVTGCLSTFVLQLNAVKPGATSAAENREALSLTLGQALFHLSRKSVSAPIFVKPQCKEGVGATSVDDYQSHNKLQVSVIMNVASLVLGHDMRRLNDITVFRRYWYRTALVETIFIGSKKDQDKEVLLAPPPSGGVASSDSSDGGIEDSKSGAVNLDNSISAAIVVAASVEDFRVSANVAQVMGNADLLVSHLQCLSHCDVSHNELVLFQLAGKLVRGEFDARGGVVAGSIVMDNAGVFALSKSQHGCTPEHFARASLSLAEGKVDYMGLSILLARATELKISAQDQWEGLRLGDELDDDKSDEFASIQVKTQFTWNKLQVAIHRSTTQHLFNIAEKLYDFVMQQRRRTERTLGNMLPAGSAAKKALQAYRKEQERIATTVIREDSRHHWLWAVKVWSMELMEVLGIRPPQDAHHEISLGGVIGLAGNSVCITCFHGPSFRETERAVFNIDNMSASFSTQAIPGLGRWSNESISNLRTGQQIVKLSLEEGGANTSAMATIHRVSTGRANVPNITNKTDIQEWLAYACIDTWLHDEDFSENSSTLVRLSRKLSVQQVLLVPAFSLSLINDHFWPLEETGIPKVECTLTSTFTDSISVTTTVDHYLFLHDVVKGYIDYLDKHRIKPAMFLTKVETGSQVVDESSSLPPRLYECVCWELNPHLCLLTTVSGQFNPHISWLLERLGFKEARTTIPKSLQRGAMDPLDKVVSMAVELLVKLTASKKKNLMLIQSSNLTSFNS